MATNMGDANKFGLARNLRLLTAIQFAMALYPATSALADTTNLTVASASQGTNNVPTTITFPVTRVGDTTYDVAVDYHTIDGTALACVDYVAASGSIIIPAGSASTSIDVALEPNTSNSPNLTFQLLLDAAVGISPTPSFATQQPFTTGHLPISVTVADVNGDGKPDLIVANYYGNTVSVLLNNSVPGAVEPSFSAQQTYAAGPYPSCVIAADVNGDGKPDLIVLGGLDGSRGVLINTTAPGSSVATFAAQQTIGTGLGQYSVVATDVNGDGKPDLVIANYGGSTISVLLNTTASGSATASFAAQQSFDVGIYPYAVAAADINGDGKPDLVVANANSNTVSVLLNATTPGATTAAFATQQSFATGQTPDWVAVVDINGDGKPDILVANGGDATVGVMVNTTSSGAASPSFTAQQTFPTGLSPTTIVAADLNGDGKPDLIVANFTDNSISILLNLTAPNATNPSFGPQRVLATGVSPISMTAADLSGDGKVDVITANYSDDTVSVLLNTTGPVTAISSFAEQQTFATKLGPISTSVADINGDGKPDMIVANDGDNSISVLLNSTLPGATSTAFTQQQTFAVGVQPHAVATADINGDGKVDIVVANEFDNTVSVLSNTTVPGSIVATFAAQQTFATGSSPISIVVADVNDDGVPDLITANEIDGTVSVLINTTAPGTGPSFAAQKSFDTGTYPFSVAAADINSDGKLDLIVANYFDDTVSVLLNTTAPGAAVPSFASQQTFATGSGPLSVSTTDVNGDGKPDMVVANSHDNSVSILLNTTAPGATTPSFSAQATFTVGDSPDSVSLADINGDGKPDLIVSDFYSNAISLLLNATPPGSTTPIFAAQQMFAAGSNPFSVVTADINGDGTPDVMFVNSGDNTISTLLNTQYRCDISGSPATGTITHDHIFGNGFE